MDPTDVNAIQEMDANETTVHVAIRLPPGYMYVPDQHHYLNLSSSDESVVTVPPFDLPDRSFDWRLPVDVRGEGRTVLRLEGQVFFCPANEATLCIYATVDEEWTVRVRAGSDRCVELFHEVRVMEALDTALMMAPAATTEVKDC